MCQFYSGVSLLLKVVMLKLCSCVIPDPLSRGIIDYVDDLTN